MPRQAADLEEALNKKGGLTLSQLANYDDLITDALVDRVYFWSSIRKLKANYHACRGVQEETVCKILQEHVIIEKDPIEAHAELLKLPGIAKFSRSLRTDDEKEHFERHLRKYVNIYLPDCPFEVDTTNRYTIMTAEACIKARKTIRKGEAVKYLSGIQVEMTEKEEKELSSRTDFSIVLSSRRKRPSLFLGPARFANHDCDSNAKLTTTGPHGIHIVARKDIRPGDEITVTYGEDYFGIDNCECLCATCESLQRNGWDPRGPIVHEDSSDDEDEEDEEETETGNSRTNVKSEPQSRSPSTLGKRKRINDEAAVNQNSGMETEGKRGRGRPRKYLRAEDAVYAWDYSTSPRERNEMNDNNGFADVARDSHGRYPLQPPNAATPTRSGSTPDRPEFSPSSNRSGSPTSLLERIFNLLESIGERKLQEQEQSKSNSATPKSSHQATAGAEPESTPGFPSGQTQKPSETPNGNSKENDSPLSSTRTSPPYARGLSRSPSMEKLSPQRSKSNDRSRLEVPKSKLHAVKKERSVSSLRNVINAEDEDGDIFSISSSPAPSAQAKRAHGNTSTKDQREDQPQDSTGSSSPSSQNNDTFSSTSQTSSLTSLDSETFTAGNIASNICNLLVEDDDEEELEDEPKASKTTEVKDVDAMEIDEPSSSKRGRQQLRKSPRKGATAVSTPPVQSIEEQQQDEDSDDEEEKRGEARTPGDYHLTSSLLPTTYHRWVECRNCDEFFVQGDAYLTRIACPRCERHSKLYGYYWPKTDKEGKFDREERVLDHRTIHRFIDPEEERSERKGRKTLVDVIKEKEMSERTESQEREERLEKRLRNSPRRSESRRKMRMTM